MDRGLDIVTIGKLFGKFLEKLNLIEKYEILTSEKIEKYFEKNDFKKIKKWKTEKNP